MKKHLFKGKSARTKTFTVITVGIILAVLALNYLLTFLVGKNAFYIDLTPETLYTLSDEMKKECEFIDGLEDGENELKIIFCTDPDSLVNSTVTRVPYFMALQMQREYKNLTVETVNVSYNPTALAKYKATSLTKIEPSDIIVAYGDTYRIVSAQSFWMVTSENTYFSYNGEYRMATLLMSVTAVNKPAAYFIKGHGETYYDPSDPNNASNEEAAALYGLLSERGLTVGVIDLTKDEIPEDCALLIINNPKTDFDKDRVQGNELIPETETRKIDRYLRKNQGALMVARDYEATSLDNLDAFLFEWGFKFGDALVSDEENIVDGGGADRIIGVYETETDSYANAIYGEFASIPSAPYTVFENTGYIECSFYETTSRFESGSSNVQITYNSFMTSHDTATAERGGVVEKKDEELDLAAVTVRYGLDDFTSEAEFSYVFCSNSANFFSNALLGNSSYANFDIVSALVNNISRTDVYASVELGGSSMNSPKYGGKQLVYDTLDLNAATVYNGDGTYKETIKAFTNGAKAAGIIISVSGALLPLVIGVIVKIRRKYL